MRGVRVGHHLALVLRHGGQDVNGQLVSVWAIDVDELDSGLHQRGDESKVSRQAVELSAEAVVLDFVYPERPGRRFHGSRGRQIRAARELIGAG